MDLFIATHLKETSWLIEDQRSSLVYAHLQGSVDLPSVMAFRDAIEEDAWIVGMIGEAEGGMGGVDMEETRTEVEVEGRIEA